MANKLQVTLKKTTPHQTEFFVSEVDEKGTVIRELAGPYDSQESADLELVVRQRKTGKSRAKYTQTSFGKQERQE